MIKIGFCEPARTYLFGTGGNEVVTSVYEFCNYFFFNKL
jgi:hypothetical protein